MMKLMLVLLMALLSAACSSAPAAIVVSGTTFDGEQIARGQQLYAQNCASCHGVSGEGQFPDAPLERDATGRYGAPPHNGNGHTWHHGDAVLIEYVRNGGISLTDPTNWYPMPAFGEQLTDEEIMLTLAYIKTFWTAEQAARQSQATAGEAERDPLQIQIQPGG